VRSETQLTSETANSKNKNKKEKWKRRLAINGTSIFGLFVLVG
jgi:hypothetical protein